MNTEDKQLCFLRELILAKQAYDRSRSELLDSIGREGVSRDNFDSYVNELAKDDARELTIANLALFKIAIKL